MEADEQPSQPGQPGMGGKVGKILDAVAANPVGRILMVLASIIYNGVMKTTVSVGETKPSEGMRGLSANSQRIRDETLRNLGQHKALYDKVKTLSDENGVKYKNLQELMVQIEGSGNDAAAKKMYLAFYDAHVQLMKEADDGDAATKVAAIQKESDLLSQAIDQLQEYAKNLAASKKASPDEEGAARDAAEVALALDPKEQAEFLGVLANTLGADGVEVVRKQADALVKSGISFTPQQRDAARRKAALYVKMKGPGSGP